MYFGSLGLKKLLSLRRFQRILFLCHTFFVQQKSGGVMAHPPVARACLIKVWCRKHRDVAGLGMKQVFLALHRGER